MALLVTVQPLDLMQPQMPTANGERTSARVSRTKFRIKRVRRPSLEEHVIPTRSAASSVTWLRVSVDLPPSQARVAQADAISDELKHLSREELVALARKAEGSMQATEEDAVTFVRRLRDEWESRAD